MNKIVENFPQLQYYFDLYKEANRQFNIKIYQGSYSGHDFFPSWLKENPIYVDEIRSMIASLLQTDESKNLIVGRKRLEIQSEIKQTEAKLNVCDSRYYSIQLATKNKYLEELDWDWFWQNNVLAIAEFSRFAPELILFSFMYGWNEVDTKERFIRYYHNCPLELYYADLNLHLKDQYGLIKVPNNWILKTEQTPKVFDPTRNTHVIVRHVPLAFFKFLSDVKGKYGFSLSLRPDYEICGDGIKDVMGINEELEKGSIFAGSLSTIPKINCLYDAKQYQDCFIVSHKDQDITFEELLDDISVDNESIVTQVIHMQYFVKDRVEYISHIDHEYVFYKLNEYENKRSLLGIKGEAQPRYKTFKIDNAEIPFTEIASDNILYQALMAYFSKIELINEYFDNKLS